MRRVRGSFAVISFCIIEICEQITRILPFKYQQFNMPVCCIKKCGARKNENLPQLTLHRFPKNERLKKKWLEAIGVENINPRHKEWYLCSLHFQDTCFNRTLDVMRLHANSVPTVFSEITTVTEALPTSKSILLKPIEDVQVQDTPDNTQDLPRCSTKVCRVCLVMDVKMYDLKDIELREMFQNITGIAVTENNHPILERLCWECAGILKAAAAFRNKALLSGGLLQGLANTGKQIRKNYITRIKDSEDYLKTAATLTVVEAFHFVDIGPENVSIPPLSDNNDTKIVQNTVRKDFLKINIESIIEEDNDQTDVEDEPMIEAPINSKMEYNQFDHIYITGEESSNVFLKTDPIFIPLKEDTINSANSNPPPSCSHVKPKYPIPGYILKTPGDREDKIKKHVIKITKRDSISKIVSKNSKEFISAKSKNINVKIGGISKKTSNLK